MKRIAFLMILVCFVGSQMFSPNVFAAEADPAKISTIQEYQEKLISELSLKNPQTDSELYKVIDGLKERVDELLIPNYYTSTQSTTLLPNTSNSSDDELDMNKYLDDNLALGQFESHSINDNLTIITTNSPVFYIHQTTADETPEDPEENGDFKATAAKYKNTKTFTSSYTAKNFLNMKLFTVKTKGYFQYNGSNVKAKLNDAWYTKAFLSIWQVSNWKKGTYKKGKNYAELYGRGNFHFGLEIKGYGLVVQDQYIKVYLTANKKGTVWKKWSVK
ncbi:hypothetical protein NST36_18950 [Bacillus sp. FSL R5-0293]|uniref:hypothetical protein n=1 Tax=Bacillus sp. FSL R5-0293 TaxID=2954584 RepID=UPI0030F6565D